MHMDMKYIFHGVTSFMFFLLNLILDSHTNAILLP